MPLPLPLPLPLPRMARRSANEVAAWLDIIGRRREVQDNVIVEALAEVEQVVSILVKPIKTSER